MRLTADKLIPPSPVYLSVMQTYLAEKVHPIVVYTKNGAILDEGEFNELFMFLEAWQLSNPDPSVHMHDRVRNLKLLDFYTRLDSLNTTEEVSYA